MFLKLSFVENFKIIFSFSGTKNVVPKVKCEPWLPSLNFHQCLFLINAMTENNFLNLYVEPKLQISLCEQP